jgi:hypothetical protein
VKYNTSAVKNKLRTGNIIYFSITLSFFSQSPAIPRQVTPAAVEAPAEQQIFDTLSRRYHSSLPHFVKNPGKKIIQDFYFLQTAVYYLLL